MLRYRLERDPSPFHVQELCFQHTPRFEHALDMGCAVPRKLSELPKRLLLGPVLPDLV